MNFLALYGMGDLATVLFVLLMGILIVFLGITIIIITLIIIGKVFDKINNKEQPKQVDMVKEEPTEVLEGLDNKTKAAIIGAIYMYYLNEGSNCEFVVKKIKKI